MLQIPYLPTSSGICSFNCPRFSLVPSAHTGMCSNLSHLKKIHQLHDFSNERPSCQQGQDVREGGPHCLFFLIPISSLSAVYFSHLTAIPLIKGSSSFLVANLIDGVQSLPSLTSLWHWALLSPPRHSPSSPQIHSLGFPLNCLATPWLCFSCKCGSSLGIHSDPFLSFSLAVPRVIFFFLTQI